MNDTSVQIPDECELKSVYLKSGECPVCHGPIDKEWAGENPSPGTTCRKCFDKRKEVFGLENVEISAVSHIVYDPIFGAYELHFDWSGTKIIVNDRPGTIRQTYLGSSSVDFGEKYENGHSRTESVKGIDYWSLKDMYQELGGTMTPPPLDLPVHVATKAPLRKKTILPVEIKFSDGQVYGVEVKPGNLPWGREVPYLHSLHAICNLFVRWRYGLAPNFACEGGIIGRGFEIRNHMMARFPGISVHGHLSEELRHIKTPDELKHVLTGLALQDMLIDQQEMRVFEETGVFVCDVTLETVLGTWAAVMELLLKYNWHKESDSTIGGRYHCYCVVQDLLLNLLTPDQLESFLSFCKCGKMVHAGSLY